MNSNRVPTTVEPVPARRPALGPFIISGPYSRQLLATLIAKFSLYRLPVELALTKESFPFKTTVSADGGPGVAYPCSWVAAAGPHLRTVGGRTG